MGLDTLERLSQDEFEFDCSKAPKLKLFFVQFLMDSAEEVTASAACATADLGAGGYGAWPGRGGP